MCAKSIANEPLENALAGCPLRTKLRKAGDLQLESVLSLLFLRPRRHDTFPMTAILDYGCGSGSLLEGLRTFPPYILQKIRYVGIDEDEKAVAASKLVAFRSDSLTPKIRPLAHVLAECRIGTFDEFRKRPLGVESFHIVNVLNVLHHLHPWRTIPGVCALLFKLTAVGGHLVFHDFFLGDYPRNLDVSTYGCPGAVYYGPGEITTIFNSVGGAPAYRFFKKSQNKAVRQPDQTTAESDKSWFGFTYVLKKFNMLWHPADSDFVTGSYYALREMTARAKKASRRPDDWYSKYAKHLAVVSEEMKAALKVTLFDYLQQYRDRRPHLRALYWLNDPFFH